MIESVLVMALRPRLTDGAKIVKEVVIVITAEIARS